MFRRTASGLVLLVYGLCVRDSRIVFLQIAERALTVSDRIKTDVMWNMKLEISVPWAVCSIWQQR